MRRFASARRRFLPAGGGSRLPGLEVWAARPRDGDHSGSGIHGREMNAPAGNNWISHMGNLPGWRYSSLTQINKSNVATLKEAWHINLGTCPTARRTPRAARSRRTPSSYEGTYYFTTPKGEMFALDATTGAAALEVHADLRGRLQRRHRRPPARRRDRRGQGLRRHARRLPHRARPADRRAVVWKTEVGPWRKGGKVSAAPIYANGIVLVGDSTGDNGGISASMHAYDAANGRELWTWTRRPAEGQPGGNTWPKNDPQGRHYAGGSMWESPIVDTKRGLAIFGTGNPNPWNSRGPGKNLWTDSIVALNLYTGQLVWGYQTDAPRPLGLGPAEQRRHVRRKYKVHEGQGQVTSRSRARSSGRRPSRSVSRRVRPSRS